MMPGHQLPALISHVIYLQVQPPEEEMAHRQCKSEDGGQGTVICLQSGCALIVKCPGSGEVRFQALLSVSRSHRMSPHYYMASQLSSQ